MRSFRILFLAVLIASAPADHIAAQSSATTPTPGSLIVGDTPTPTDPRASKFVLSNGHLTSSSGWSVSWDASYWNLAPRVSADGITLVTSFGTLQITEINSDSTYSCSVACNRLTFRDTRECLKFFTEKSSWYSATFASDGKELFEATPEKSWGVFLASQKYFVYVECRMLRPGRSYVQLATVTSHRDTFNLLAPEIQAVSDSLTIQGQGTPTSPSSP